MINASDLYWSLPSPTAFIHAVTDAARDKRAVIINHPTTVDLATGIREGLRNANVHEPTFLHVYPGASIADLLAPHFADKTMTASDLALHVSSGSCAVVLQAKGDIAQEACMKYATEYVDALAQAKGNAKLILTISHSEFTKIESTEQFAIVPFDGALHPEEMHAYVAFKMVGRREFHSTHLLRHLITEFAAFDPALADELIKLSETEILNLPQSLTNLVAKDEARWASKEWIAGTESLTCPDVRHPLRDWYLAQHQSQDGALFSNVSKDAINRIYWKACIRAITPWLEERRAIMLKELRTILLKLEPKGKFDKLVGKNTVVVSLEELEYNDLCHQATRVRQQGLIMSARQENAFRLCYKAKTVRDDLAHCRKPSVEALQDLVGLMDHFLRQHR